MNNNEKKTVAYISEKLTLRKGRFLAKMCAELAELDQKLAGRELHKSYP